jgi:hypothetical protein
MPDVGRMRICEEARAISGPGRVSLVSMPRDNLVPYGGAAPVDVYFAVAAEQAVVCVVMASYADQRAAARAIEAGLDELEPVLLLGAKRRGKGKRGREQLKTLPDSRAAVAKTKSRSNAPRAMAGLMNLTRGTANPVSMKQPPPPTITHAAPPPLRRVQTSVPTIDVGEAQLGRETLLAIETDERIGAGPPMGSPNTSAPDLRVELVSIGRTTELDLRGEEAKRIQSQLDATRSDPVLAPGAPRMTQPWVEAPPDAKRSVEAAKKGRKSAPPKVTLKLEDPDSDVMEAILVEDPPAQPERKKGANRGDS